MVPRLARAVVIAAGLVVGSVVAGCGGSPEVVPPKEARLAVLSFVQAVQERRFSDACGLLTSEAQTDLREDVLGASG